jgi:hypothetical protein
VVIEAGVVAVYLIAWAARKARRVASRLDAEVDAAIDASLDRLHEVIATKLAGQRALADLDEEAGDGDGQVSELTRRQLERAVATEARDDDAFGQAVIELVAELRAAEKAAGTSVAAGPGSTIFTGDAHARASGGGIAIGQAGNVNVDRADRERSDPS